MTALKSVRVVDMDLGDGTTKRSVTAGTHRASAVLRALGIDKIDPPVPPKPPSGPDCVHEIKHNRYRLIVRRNGPTVRPHPTFQAE